ncbi:restriction endonuclease subunit S [Brevibacillus choshinensis]|uniref:Restriction endonuclease subunit S n=1 Tax=Brevibacillus choshinensis TaxID=54911 RepID=A0ABX7FJR2_BRECH|nr:restriction endonuclease subunit S [Brevibacillus choshinensis]QRG65964.1 restriction endonuclease subunit S [Brevibacillus choshinensis]
MDKIGTVKKLKDNTSTFNEWKIRRLSEIIESLDSGVSVNSTDSPIASGEFGVLKTSAVSNGYFHIKENKKILDDELGRARLNPKKGAILISRANTPELVGEVGYVDKDYENLYLSDKIWQATYKVKVDGKWLANILSSPSVKNRIKVLATGTSNSMKNISKENFLSLEIPFPKYEEQQELASILSTWDKAIELKEKLIEQKKEQKKGLMQKLLTGKVRLSGFNEKWVEAKLGDLLIERKEIGYNDLELLAITSLRGIVRRTEVDIKDNSSEDKSKYKRIMPLDIGYNTMRMWQGVSGVSKYEGIVSPAYTILKPTNRVNSHFVGYLFKLPHTINLFRRYSQGLVDDTLNLKYENLKVIKVIIPQDVSEQKAIAEVLLYHDQHIELIENELEFLKQQKKGLIQLLLTGKVRVKV